MTVSRKIMLIDDDPDDQLFFRDAIQVISPEFQCELVSNCREAFQKIGNTTTAGVYLYGFKYAGDERI